MQKYPVKLDPFQNKILEKLEDVHEYLNQGFWDLVVKESFSTILLCLECLLMDHAGIKVYEQLKKEKVYFDSLVGVLQSKGVEIKNRSELDKLRYFRNRIEHEHVNAEKHDAEWAYEVARSFVSSYYPAVTATLEERNHRVFERRSEKGAKIKVADEVWIACALLHKENPNKHDFSIREILERIERENIFGEIRPGIYVHLNLHCVANKAPNPAKYRMLYETEHGRRRLFKSTDYYHPEREGGKVKPNAHEIPEKYRYLLDWYEKQYNT